MLVLSLPLRLGGGAFGGSFLVVVVVVVVAVVVAVAVVAAVATVATEAVVKLLFSGKGWPCLCFGTAGSGFFVLPTLPLPLPLPLPLLGIVGLITSPPPPTLPALGVVEESPLSLSLSLSLPPSLSLSRSGLLLLTFDAPALLLSLNGLPVFGGLPNFEEAVLDIDRLLALECGRWWWGDSNPAPLLLTPSCL